MMINLKRANTGSKAMFKNLEEKGITKGVLLNTAKKELSESRADGGYKYTDAEIQSSKHPRKTCKLCGQKGCDVKYVGLYFHKKCIRKLRKDGKELIGD